MLSNIAVIIKVLISAVEFLIEQQRLGKIKDVHSIITDAKNAKTDQERDEISKKIANFWARNS